MFTCFLNSVEASDRAELGMGAGLEAMNPSIIFPKENTIHKNSIAYLGSFLLFVCALLSMVACVPSATIQTVKKQGDSWSVGYWLDKDPRLVDSSDSNGERRLFSAIRGKNIMVRVLIAHGVGINYVDRMGLTALRLAIAVRNTEAARVLIEKGANINAADMTGRLPIHSAAAEDDVEMMKALIGRGADINAHQIRRDAPPFRA